jgi:hypothetical protein
MLCEMLLSKFKPAAQPLVSSPFDELQFNFTAMPYLGRRLSPMIGRGGVASMFYTHRSLVPKLCQVESSF